MNLFDYLKDPEFIGVIFGVVSVIFIIQENILAWAFGSVNVILFIYVFYEKKIYGQVLLQFFFLILQFYGFWSWNKKNNTNESDLKLSHIKNLQTIFLSILFIILSSISLYLVLYNQEKLSILIFLDLLITSLSFLAQYFQAKKIIENWQIWIFVDILSIYLFYQSKLYKVCLFYSILLFLASYGYYEWNRRFKKYT
jgi:nicotinamide mononucleotide transporter